MSAGMEIKFGTSESILELVEGREREGNTDIQFEGEKLEVHPGFFPMCNHITASRWVIWDLLRHLGSRKDCRGAVGFSCAAEKFGEGPGCHPGSRKGQLSPG